ncbi:MAG: hypothetical protein Q4A45_07085 [Clostridia bacterium]|nr:hypothetical protein [Clostridia bacterium]
MRGDLNDQLQRAQAGVTEDKAPKYIVIAAAVLLVSFLVAVIAGTVFFIKALDKFSEPSPDTTAGQTAQGGIFGSSVTTTRKSAFGGFGKTQAGNQQLTSNFQYGKVDGTSYYSEFSGISFNAPSGWTLTSFNGSTTNLLYPKDFSASSENLSASVVLSYEAMSAKSYSSASDALKSSIIIANTGDNAQMLDENVSAKFGGNKFTGIRYKKTMDASYAYYVEVLCAEVNGYALKITVQANTEEELNSVIAMFK